MATEFVDAPAATAAALPRRDTIGARLAWLILAVIIVSGVALRAPGEQWLDSAADAADFSFHPDDERFVLAAKDIKAPIPDGYPQGMTTQLYLLHALVGSFTHASMLQLLRGISIFYAGVAILLTYAIARSWQPSRGCALVAAAMVAVAPLLLVQSNFGTADVTAISYFYATLLAGGVYLRTRSQLWFLIFCVLVGATTGVKFFISLLAPLALILAVQRKGDRIAQLLSAAMCIVTAFEALCFFKFAPWDLNHLYTMLYSDNVVIPGVKSDIVASSPLDQLLRYGWDVVSAVGIPVAALFALAMVRWLPSLRQAPARIKGALAARDWRPLVTPASLFVVALVCHALLLLASKIHAERHILVFVPLICVAGARALFELGLPLLVQVPLIGVLLGFQFVDSASIEQMYRLDVRNDLASWTQGRVGEGHEVVTMAPFSQVRGTRYIYDQNPLLLDPSAYLVTCDFEYQRYLHHTRASEIFHPMGGQERLDFFNAVFAGTSEFKIVRDFRSAPRGVEMRLIDAHLLPTLGTFVPQHCFALGHSSELSPDAQRASASLAETAPRGW